MSDLRHRPTPSRQSVNREIEKSKNVRRGFTLVELLVVIGMIALIAASMTTSVSAAMQRARVQKATSEVKMLTQAFNSYANYNKGKLPTIAQWTDINFSDQKMKFLNGESNGEIPVLIQAALSSGGIMRDPWGKPYRVKIQQAKVYAPSADSAPKTGYYLPNFYRLTKEERQ